MGTMMFCNGIKMTMSRRRRNVVISWNAFSSSSALVWMHAKNEQVCRLCPQPIVDYVCDFIGRMTIILSMQINHFLRPLAHVLQS